MVTKKKVVTPELRHKQLRVYPEQIVYSYGRRDDIGIVTRIRYDPNYSAATLKDPLCEEYTTANFFLSRLHYEQLVFTLHNFPWNYQFTYEQYMKLLTDYFLFAKLSPKFCYIITTTVKMDGSVELSNERTEPIKNMFAGLVDHIRIVEGDPIETTDETETYLVGSKPKPVYIDTDLTFPSKYTLFDLSDDKIYNDAAIRVKKGYKLDDELELSEYEVLLWSSVQYVMSTERNIIALFKDDTWYVPHASSCGRQDPLRMVLLEHGIVEEALFNVQRLEPGDDVLLISAQYGVQRGVLLGDLPEPLSRYSRNRKSKPSILTKRTELQVQNSEAVAQRMSEAVRTAGEGAVNGVPGTTVLKFTKPKSPES